MNKWKVEVEENTQLSVVVLKKSQKIKGQIFPGSVEKIITVFFTAETELRRKTEWAKFFEPGVYGTFVCFIKEKVCFEMKIYQLALCF